MTNLSLASIKATGGTTTRTLGSRFADVINVKDYGATGDGSTDDTAAIQLAFDAAFGSYSSPHGGEGGGNPELNRPLYFPGGVYRVSATATAITGAANNGSGAIRLTVSSTSGMVNNEPINVTSVVGTTEANGLWGATVVDGTHLDLIGSTFSNTFSSSPSALVTTSALKIRSLQGGHIYGAGRFATKIACNTLNAPVITTNPMGFSVVEKLEILAHTGGICFNLFWQLVDVGGTVSCQSNTFRDCFFNTGLAGLAIGVNGQMCSENTIQNCYISGCTHGIYISNANALQMTVLGGNIASCTNGIYVAAGSCPTIHGVGFQHNLVADINVVFSSGDNYSIVACRREQDFQVSTFVIMRSGASAHISGCLDAASIPGNSFCAVDHPGSVTIETCQSTYGILSSLGSGGFVNVTGYRCGALDAFDTYDGTLNAKDCRLGDWLYMSVPKYVFNQRTTNSPSIVRQYGTEAAALTADHIKYASNSLIAGQPQSATVTISNASPGVVTLNGHYILANTPIVLTTTGALPTGLTASKTYYVKTVINANTFTLSATVGGAVINTSSAGSGVHSLYISKRWAVGDEIKNTAVAAAGSPGWVCTTAGYTLAEAGGGSLAVFKTMPNVAA